MPGEKARGFCRDLLLVWPARWAFVAVEGVEPTNNMAEWALRPAVPWRKGCYGTDSDSGSRFVERILTVTTQAQARDRQAQLPSVEESNRNWAKRRTKMNLRVVGAGLPRTGTSSLKEALEHLLGGRCYHMAGIPGHPNDLGSGWNRALAGDTPDWDQLFDGYVAAVDWPASLFWRELSAANPDAPVLLSVRDTADAWWHSADETILPYARMALAPDWNGGRGFLALLERFTGTERWDDPATMMAAYERHNAEVRESVPQHRLLEWRAAEGWAPICHALGLPRPDLPFPWRNRRSDWTK